MKEHLHACIIKRNLDVCGGGIPQKLLEFCFIPIIEDPIEPIFHIMPVGIGYMKVPDHHLTARGQSQEFLSTALPRRVR
jgi:hypothetical protein